jgi:hypothetical protein
MNVQISELQAAQARKVTSESLIEQMIDQLPVGFAENEDDFYRALR